MRSSWILACVAMGAGCGDREPMRLPTGDTSTTGSADVVATVDKVPPVRPPPDVAVAADDGNSDEAIAAAVLKQLRSRFKATKPYKVYFKEDWSYRRAKHTGVILGRYRDAWVDEEAPGLRRCQQLAVDITQQVDDKGRYYKLSTGAVGLVKTFKCPAK